MTKKPLEMGDIVWIEATGSYIRTPNKERSISEYQIVDANNSSAYAVAIERLEMYNEDPKRHAYMKRRIEQRSHRVKSDGLGTHFVLWLSKEAFERNVAYNTEIREVRQQARKVLDGLSLADLKKFLSEFQ